MGYHLEIRPRAEETARQVEELRAALAASGCAPAGEWAWLAKVGSAEAKITLRVPVDGPAFASLEFPFGAPAEEAGKALDLAIAIADRLGFRVDDPQLGQQVQAGDRPSVERRFADSSAWAVRYAGQSEDPRSIGAETVIPVAPKSSQLGALAALALLIVGAFVAAELLGRWMLPDEPPPAYADPPDGGR